MVKLGANNGSHEMGGWEDGMMIPPLFLDGKLVHLNMGPKFLNPEMTSSSPEVGILQGSKLALNVFF